MKSLLLYQCLILHIIIYTSGVTGEFFTFAVIGAIGAGIAYFKPNIYNEVKNSRLLNGHLLGGEACTTKFINADNIEYLKWELNNQVHGQEVAISHTIAALRNHLQSRYHQSKALALSFHGLPGTGKTFIAEIIISMLYPRYKEKGSSRFVHKYNARIHFPNENFREHYKRQLSEWIRTNVTACERAIFIFDEVDKFPKGLLDVVKPFIDHHAYFDGVSYKNAMFFFLSNAGGTAIMDRLIELRTPGKLPTSCLNL